MGKGSVGGMMRAYQLVEAVKAYDPAADEEAIDRAYVYAMRQHGTQTRANGDPYFSHPIEVAGLLTQMRLDSASIVTALLHDTVEDTSATLDDIRRLFGDETARLVDGVTKLTRLELQSSDTKQAENFRKLVMAMSEDIRVLLVKLADRLHNMRTLRFIKKEDKRLRIARETRDIYAPLAERIGMEAWKDELEDLAFAELMPDARKSVLGRLDYLRERGHAVVDEIINEISEKLAAEDIPAEVSGREKRPWSIWQKMQRKSITFEQLADIMAFRVTVDTVPQCYQALGVIHSTYRMIPGRFKDYISTPKPNGYQSLHTGVLIPDKQRQQRIELQIRTREMHEVAEIGLAAHWRYKGSDPKTDAKHYRWLQDILDTLKDASSPAEFLDHTRLDLFSDRVFCFTPKGDLFELPAGSTPVDFAYSVHSAIGDHCSSAKINGRIMPLRTVLQNGDQVEIITARTKTPSAEWERFVVTAKAKARIRRIVRTQQRDQFVQLGKAIVLRAFRAGGKEFTEKVAGPALKHYGVKTVEDLFAHVGEGQATGRDVLRVVFPEEPATREGDKVVPLSRARNERKVVSGTASVPIRNLISGMAVHYARCCHPLPGDRIVGIVTTGKGVTIHTADCETLQSFAHTPERWLDVAWDDEGGPDLDRPHVGRVELTAIHQLGSLATVTGVIAQSKGNITNLKFTNRTRDFFEMLIDIEVSGVRHLSNIIAALRALPSITSVERARS